MPAASKPAILFFVACPRMSWNVESTRWPPWAVPTKFGLGLARRQGRASREQGTGIPWTLALDDRDGQGVAAIGVAHQPIVGCGGSGRRWVGGKRQDLTPRFAVTPRFAALCVTPRFATRMLIKSDLSICSPETTEPANSGLCIRQGNRRRVGCKTADRPRVG